MLPNKSRSEDMYGKKMQRVFNDLNPVFFDPTSDDQVKMRENVRHKKIAKTIMNLTKINAQNVGVHDFLPRWATNAYFDSLHGKKASEDERTSVGIEEIKIYVGEIIAKARERVLKKASSLKVPQDFDEPLKKDEIDENINERRRAMEAVHEQLLNSFNSVTGKRKMDNCEKIRAKTEEMMAIHAELKRMVFLKGLCLEDDIDDCLVPRKLILFDIEDFQKVPQITETPLAQRRDVDPPSISEESVANHSVDCMIPSKEKKRSMSRRFLRFFGFNTA